MKAWSLIREMPAYRRDAFAAGLAAAGYSVRSEDYYRFSVPAGDRRGDVLVIWNRYGTVELLANTFEAQGGRVIVAENGYLGADAAGVQNYALALRGHNGSGEWKPGGPERWERLGIELKPWRTTGDYILVLPNRSFGPKGFCMPQEWAVDAARRARCSGLPVKVRPHPGNWQQDAATVREGLAHDIAGARAVVIYSSSAGLHALIAGVPVVCEAPYWIAKGAAVGTVLEIEHLGERPDRAAAFEALAWAQWSVAEIANGEPFKRLLED